MKKLALLALLFLPLGLLSPVPGQAVAQSESEELATYIQCGYQEYLRDYIHVFLGYNLCKYRFVDETTLTALADDVLRRMTTRAEEIIRSRQPSTLSPEAVHYAAQFAVLTSVGLASTMITDELSPAYQDSASCESSAAENRRRYEALKAFERP